MQRMAWGRVAMVAPVLKLLAVSLTDWAEWRLGDDSSAAGDLSDGVWSFKVLILSVCS